MRAEEPRERAVTGAFDSAAGGNAVTSIADVVAPEAAATASIVEARRSVVAIGAASISASALQAIP
jgi:hypothetical protein